MRLSLYGGRERGWLGSSPGGPAGLFFDDYFGAGIWKSLAELVHMESFSEFRKDIYLTLLNVPAGITVTYARLAALAGHKGAARAVGHALSVNPVPLIIPCHRVVGAAGPGGFSAGQNADEGLKIKKILLDQEFINTKNK